MADSKIGHEAVALDSVMPEAGVVAEFAVGSELVAEIGSGCVAEIESASAVELAAGVEAVENGGADGYVYNSADSDE